MPTDISVIYRNKSHICKKYGRDDEPHILDGFFFWKTAVLLAEQTRSKKPQLPETFSERFCCLVCNLVHKPGAGYDAFRLDDKGQVVATVKIKATITGSGFTDVKRSMDFDELYWLSFTHFSSLRYEICRLKKDHVHDFVVNSRTARDRGTVSIEKIAKAARIHPIQAGRIGVIIGA